MTVPRTRSVWALVLAAVLVSPTPALALDPDPTLGSGTLLPVRPEASAIGTVMQLFGPSLVGVSRSVYTEYTAPSIDLRSTTDGSVVRTLPLGGTHAGDQLDGTTLLHTQAAVSGTGVTVLATDVLTDAARWSIDVPSGEVPFARSADWVLSWDVQSHGTVLRRPGRPDLDLPQMPLTDPRGSSPPTVTGDDSRLVVANVGVVYALDLGLGTVTTLQHSNYQLASVAGSDGFVVESLPSGDVLHWWATSGSGGGSVTVESGGTWQRYLAYGSGVAALVRVDGFHEVVRPVDLATGALAPPLSAPALEVHPLGDGRLVALLDDTPDGRVVVLGEGSGPRTMLDLPMIGRRVLDTAVAAGRVYLSHGEAWERVHEVWAQPVDGTGPPEPLTDDTGQVVEGTLVGASGEVLLVRVPSGSYQPDGFRVVWPGGHRDVDAGYDLVSLGSGGIALVRRYGSGTTVEDVRTGAVLASTSEVAAVAGRTLWTGPDASGAMTGRDLTGDTGDVTVATGLATCAPVQSVQVVDRFGVVRCRDDGYEVVDLLGVYRSWRLPAGVSEPRLGRGVVAWTEYRQDPTGTTYAVIVAADLGPARTVRLFGPAHAESQPPPPTVAVDDSTGALVYLDSSRLLRRVDPGWLSSPAVAATDTVAPVLTSLGGSPRVVAVGGLSASWQYRDETGSALEQPSGVAGYQLRYQQVPVGADPGTSWVEPDGDAWSTGASAPLVSTPGRDTCWSVRARDRAGNVSAWSAQRCTTLDATAPQVDSVGGSPRVSSSTPVTFSWTATDPSLGPGVAGSGVVSHDVRYQQATGYGGTLGAWVQPDGWQGITTTSVSLKVSRNVDTCFAVRSRDAAGNTSGWSAPRCSWADGTAPRITSSWAGPLVVASVATSTVRFAYTASDNTGVTSYEVSYRKAYSGRPLGSWTTPSSWARTTSTSVSTSVSAGGEACFRVRARDRMGNASAWSATRCAAVPYDDRSLAASSGTARTSSSLALGRTTTTLRVPGARVWRNGQIGRSVAVVVLRGPGQGIVDVYVGSRKVGRVSLASTSWRRTVVVLPTSSFSGASVSVRSVSWSPARVDAVAILR